MMRGTRVGKGECPRRFKGEGEGRSEFPFGDASAKGKRVKCVPPKHTSATSLNHAFFIVIIPGLLAAGFTTLATA